jgi:hypothetical protein
VTRDRGFDTTFEQPVGKELVLLIDLVPFLERELRRLGVGPFHESDPGRDGRQALEVVSRPPEVGLDGQAQCWEIAT